MAQGYPQPRRGRDFRAVPGTPKVYDRPHRRYRQSLFERRAIEKQKAPSPSKTRRAKRVPRFLKNRGWYAAAATIGAAAAYYGASRRAPSADEGSIYPGTPTAPGGMFYARSYNPTEEMFDAAYGPSEYRFNGYEFGYQRQFHYHIAAIMALPDPYLSLASTSQVPPASHTATVTPAWDAAYDQKQAIRTNLSPDAYINVRQNFFIKPGIQGGIYDVHNNTRSDVYIDAPPTVRPNVASRQRPNENTAPANVPWSALQQWKQYLREVSPDPNPVPRPRVAPSTGITITIPPSGKPSVSRGPNHTFSPPTRGTKEKKGKSKFDAAFDIFGEALGFDGQKGKKSLNALTEVLDWLDAVYFSLSEETLNRVQARTPQAKAQAIYENFDEIDVATLLKNIVVMEVGDRVLAKMSKDAKETFDITTLFGAAL